MDQRPIGVMVLAAFILGLLATFLAPSSTGVLGFSMGAATASEHGTGRRARKEEIWRRLNLVFQQQGTSL